jgi:hypothetical protein
VSTNGVLLIPAGCELDIEEVDEDFMQHDDTEENNSTTAVNVKVIPTLDMRGTKENIYIKRPGIKRRVAIIQAVSNCFFIQAALRQPEHIIGHAQSF